MANVLKRLSLRKLNRIWFSAGTCLWFGLFKTINNLEGQNLFSEAVLSLKIDLSFEVPLIRKVHIAHICQFFHLVCVCV